MYGGGSGGGYYGRDAAQGIIVITYEPATAQPMHVNVSSTWKEISEAHVKVSGTWKAITSGWVKVSGVWKQFFG